MNRHQVYRSLAPIYLYLPTYHTTRAHECEPIVERWGLKIDLGDTLYVIWNSTQTDLMRRRKVRVQQKLKRSMDDADDGGEEEEESTQ